MKPLCSCAALQRRALYDPTADLPSPRSHPQALSRGHFVGRAALILVGWDRRSLHKPPQLSLKEAWGLSHAFTFCLLTSSFKPPTPRLNQKNLSEPPTRCMLHVCKQLGQPCVVIGPLSRCCHTGRVIRSKLPILRWLGRI